MLSRVELQFQHLGTCLKVLADFINHLPIFISNRELQQFHEFHSNYQELHRQFSAFFTANCDLAVIETANQQFKKLKQQYFAANAFVINFLTAGIDINPHIQKIIDQCKLLYAASLKNSLEEYGLQSEVLNQQLTLLLSEITKLPADLNKTIQTKARLTKFIKENTTTNISPTDLMSVLRIQRIITAYQRWIQILQAQLPTLMHYDLATAMLMQQLLTYDKKAFLIQIFKNQPLNEIINPVEITIYQSRLNSAAQLHLHFNAEKYHIQQKVATLELKIRARQTYLQATLGTVFLGITRQPEYQLGQISTLLSAHICNTYATIPALRTPLPEKLLTKLSHVSGLFFLSASMYLLNKVYYSCWLILLMTRILFAQTTALFNLGKLFRPLIRLDELDIIEKENLLTWLIGFTIHAGMNLGYNTSRALMSYTIGTTAATSMSALVEKYSKYFDLASITIAMLKEITYYSTYAYTYEYAYTVDFSPARSIQDQELLQRQNSLQVLGLGQYAKQREIHKRYRELAFKFHADTCAIDCNQAKQKIRDINLAYATLKKNFN